MGACLLITLPLEFVFEARVWRRPRRLVTALVPAFVLFVVWDLWASATDTWRFNPRYTIGVVLPGGMAIEELVFFVTIPICRAAHPGGRAQHHVGSGAVPRLAGARVTPVYPTLAVIAAAVTIGLELFVFRSGLFRQSAFWVAMVIVFGFMIPVDGWLTKLSAPVVIYRASDTSGLRPVWDIPLEEFAYAFALLTLVILVWDRAGAREDERTEVSVG